MFGPQKVYLLECSTTRHATLLTFNAEKTIKRTCCIKPYIKNGRMLLQSHDRKNLDVLLRLRYRRTRKSQRNAWEPQQVRHNSDKQRNQVLLTRLMHI